MHRCGVYFASSTENPRSRLFTKTRRRNDPQAHQPKPCQPEQGSDPVQLDSKDEGKTFIAIDVSFHIALGRPWTGRKTRQGCVVYVAAEGGRGVYKRLAALRKHYPDEKNVPLKPYEVRLCSL